MLKYVALIYIQLISYGLKAVLFTLHGKDDILSLYNFYAISLAIDKLYLTKLLYSNLNLTSVSYSVMIQSNLNAFKLFQ